MKGIVIGLVCLMAGCGGDPVRYLGQQPPGDSGYLFFSRRTGDSWDQADAGDVFWVDAAVIENLRP